MREGIIVEMGMASSRGKEERKLRVGSLKCLNSLETGIGLRNKRVARWSEEISKVEGRVLRVWRRTRMDLWIWEEESL